MCWTRSWRRGRTLWSQQTNSVRCPPAVYRRKMAMYAGTSVTARAAQMSFLTSLGDFPSGPLDLLSALADGCITRANLKSGLGLPACRRWLAVCNTMHRHSRSARRRASSAVTGRPQVPPGERRWDSEASSEAAGRRERTARMPGHGAVGPSSLARREHDWAAA